jgi:hypothetical protein
MIVNPGLSVWGSSLVTEVWDCLGFGRLSKIDELEPKLLCSTLIVLEKYL